MMNMVQSSFKIQNESKYYFKKFKMLNHSLNLYNYVSQVTYDSTLLQLTCKTIITYAIHLDLVIKHGVYLLL